jgi:hypothetical protein
MQFDKDGEGQLVVLGEGGFAVVYRARLGSQPVAVKARMRLLCCFCKACVCNC